VSDTARYAYAVSRALDDSAVGGLAGLRGARLDVVRHEGLDAVVSDVPLPEFGEDGLRENLERLPWLEEVARTHDEVVRGIAAQGPTAPLRLATIFHDDDAVRRRIAEWHDALVDVLDRVDGRAEWSVKVIAPPPPAREAAPAPEPTTGTEFLRRRKEQASEHAEQQESATRVAEDAHHELAQVAEATRLLQPQDPQLTGHVGAMVLNGAYLVPEDDSARFGECLEQLRGRFDQMTFEVGGPWPPYSFAVLEDPA
jgi:hypothetical protein